MFDLIIYSNIILLIVVFKVNKRGLATINFSESGTEKQGQSKN